MLKTVPFTPIGKDQCIARHIYRIHSRNLSIGVYDGAGGFVGLRTKFNDHFLFKEYYADGSAFGTVLPEEDIGILPEEIEIREYVSTFDLTTKRLVGFDKPLSKGGRGWYFLDTGEPSGDIEPRTKTYQPLFDFLKAIEGAQ